MDADPVKLGGSGIPLNLSCREGHRFYAPEPATWHGRACSYPLDGYTGAHGRALRSTNRCTAPLTMGVMFDCHTEDEVG